MSGLNATRIFRHRAENRVLGRVRFQVQRAANLFDRTAVVVPHQKRRAFLRAQPAATLPAPARQFRPRRPGRPSTGPVEALAICSSVSCGFRRLALRPGSHVVDGAVEADAIEPRGEIRSRFEPSELPIRAHERFLHDVFGVFGPTGHPVRQPVDAAAVPFDEHPEGILVAAPSLARRLPRRPNASVSLDGSMPGWLGTCSRAGHLHSTRNYVAAFDLAGDRNSLSKFAMPAATGVTRRPRSRAASACSSGQS